MKKLIIGLILVMLLMPVSCGAPSAPALTTAEQAYANAVGDQAETIGGVFAELGELLESPGFGTDDWTFRMATQLAMIRVAYDDAVEMRPPDSMAHIHYEYVRGMKHYYTMTELLAKAIDQLDADLLEGAMAEMGAGVQHIDEATELMLEFMETHK